MTNIDLFFSSLDLLVSHNRREWMDEADESEKMKNSPDKDDLND